MPSPPAARLVLLLLLLLSPCAHAGAPSSPSALRSARALRWPAARRGAAADELQLVARAEAQRLYEGVYDLADGVLRNASSPRRLRKLAAELKAYWSLTALVAAAEEGDVDAARDALAAGAPLDAAPPSDGMTALHVACISYSPGSGHLAVVRALLAAGADAGAATATGDVADGYGITPMGYAVQYESPALVRALIQFGADVHAVIDTDGELPLIKASNLGHVEVVRELLEAGADPRVENSHGQTARILAGKHVDAKKDSRAPVLALLRPALAERAADTRGRQPPPPADQRRTRDDAPAAPPEQKKNIGKLLDMLAAAMEEEEEKAVPQRLRELATIFALLVATVLAGVALCRWLPRGSRRLTRAELAQQRAAAQRAADVAETRERADEAMRQLLAEEAAAAAAAAAAEARRGARGQAAAAQAPAAQALARRRRGRGGGQGRQPVGMAVPAHAEDSAAVAEFAAHKALAADDDGAPEKAAPAAEKAQAAEQPMPMPDDAAHVPQAAAPLYDAATEHCDRTPAATSKAQTSSRGNTGGGNSDEPLAVVSASSRRVSVDGGGDGGCPHVAADDPRVPHEDIRVSDGDAAADGHAATAAAADDGATDDAAASDDDAVADADDNLAANADDGSADDAAADGSAAAEDGIPTATEEEIDGSIDIAQAEATMPPPTLELPAVPAPAEAAAPETPAPADTDSNSAFPPPPLSRRALNSLRGVRS